MPAETSKRQRRHPKDTHGVDEAARRIGVHRATLFKWINEGKVKVIERTYEGPNNPNPERRTHRSLHIDEINRIIEDREQGKRLRVQKKTWAQAAKRAREDALEQIAREEGIDLEDPKAHQELSRQMTFALKLYRIHREHKIDCDAYMQLLEDDGRLGVDPERIRADKEARAKKRRRDAGRK